MVNSLSAATLAIYIILAIPVLFLLVKHGRHGLLGWFFLFIFCSLQIIGSALAVKGSSPSASIISNVGLSPLLLAAAGILHEARIYRIQNLDQKLEWVLVLFYHMLVMGGVALTAAGSAKLQSQKQPVDETAIEKAEKITKAGIAILAIAWGVLVGFSGLSFTAPRLRIGVVARSGTVLLASVCFSLVFIGIRVFYSVAALSSQRADLNPSTGSLAIRVILGFLPGLIATLAFLAAGFKTQGSAKLADDGRQELEEPSHKPRSAPYV